MFPSAAVDLNGQLNEHKYMSGKKSEVTKAFCAPCESPFYGKNTATPNHLTLSLGTLDDANGLKIDVVIFERDKPHWDQLTPDVMSFETQPDWKP